LAKAKADELLKRVKAGEKFDAAARALGLDPKTSDPIARDGSIPEQPAQAARSSLQPEGRGRWCPLSLGQNWLVYRVSEKNRGQPRRFRETEEAGD